MTEASLAGKLMHPHIVQIFDAVVAEDQSYIVMEYVKGGTLEPFCTPSSLLPVDRLVEMIFKCTRALDYAFRAGITHRDIKPANILLACAGQQRAQQRRHQDLRLRRGDDDQRRTDAHPGLRRRLARLHVAAAGARHAAQPPDRHLFPRRGDVPVADRPAAVPVEPTTA
jgi:serine/threonine protein kinase